MQCPDFNNEIVLLDGAFGTMLQKKGLKPGEAPDLLNLTSPELVTSIHQEYVEAGSQIVLANTFGSNREKLAGSGHSVEEVIRAAIANAKKAAADRAAVALDIGPCGQLLEPMGTLPFEEAVDLFAEMVKAGVKAGADLIVIETMSDLYETRAALLAAKENSSLPVLVTMTFEEDGRTFTGCSLESMAATLEGLQADAIGLNCSTGPAEMTALLKKLTTLTRLPVIAKPNAGFPDPRSGHYHMGPEEFAALLAPLREAGVRLFGGCCGTTPECIAALAEALQDRTPVLQEVKADSAVCTPQTFVPIDQVRIIGERINPTGKKRFQQALKEKDLDYIVSVGLSQQEAGADILDVNVGMPGIDEEEMLPAVVKKLQSVLDIPLQLDSSSPTALEKALRVYNGKPAVNSVNGKKEVLDALLPVIRKYGAAVVGLTMDEEGIPDSAKKRVDIAKRIVQAAAEHGIPAYDVWIDALSLTVSAQQNQAMETLKAIRQLKQETDCHFVLGVSNISFGLPNRPLLGAAFLQQAMEEGLDLPIINPNQKEMADAVAAWKVLHCEDEGAAKYIERFAGENSVSAPSAAPETSLSLEEAIARGLKSEAAALAREELKYRKELDIVESILIPALDRVGADYESGKLFLPQLLSAAGAAQSVFEVLKTSLSEKGEESVKKGPVILATVQGDIHDIGKNIVRTVLENYGFAVIDLGRDVAPETVLQAVRDNEARLCGLSALMTTTLPAMEKTVQVLRREAPWCQTVVGGAVVTEDYARDIQADYYAKDARATAEIARKVFQDA